jgi:hypothetical protein
MTMNITLTVYSNGALVDPTSVELEDSTDTFGVRRTDNQALVVSPGTAMTMQSKGVYTHSFAEPVVGIFYEYEFKVVWNGVSYYRNYTTSALNTTNTVILPDTSSYYSSQAEVYYLIGTTAADLLEDDIAAGDRYLMWNDILDSVTSQFNLYLHQNYEQSVLLTNNWIRRRATMMATHLLSHRRGNPPHYVDELDRVYRELDEIRAGRLTLPNVPERGYFGPVVRNYQLESYRRRHPLRVEATTSTGQNYAGEDTAWEHPYWL